MSKAGFKKRQSAKEELKELKGRLSFQVPMSRYTTMRVGGLAQALYQPESLPDLMNFIRISKRSRISFLVIGGGSNIIVRDGSIKKIFIRLTSPFFKKIEVSGTQLSAGAGVPLSELCRIVETNRLGGAEFLIGIPGTVGGAIIQNAGARGASISDIIKDIKVLDEKAEVRVLKKSQADFGYRRSGLKQYIILGATFCLNRDNRRKIRRKIIQYMKRRLTTQDYTAPSAGCIFKNPQGVSVSAAELIEKSGLKGKRIGGACVSRRHSNFIINRKNAKAQDILRLIAFIKNKVNRQFGIRLEEEVKIIK